MYDQEMMGLFSVVCAMFGYGAYLRSTYQGATKPHLFSWLVWSVLKIIVFLAQMSAGAGAGAWVTGFSALASLVIAGMAVTRGEKKITSGDWVAFGMALATIPVWYFTRHALWAVILATGIEAMAYFPTFRKSYIKPFEENFVTHSIDILKWVVALTALESLTLTTMLYPLFLLGANCILVGMILWRRAMAKKSGG